MGNKITRKQAIRRRRIFIGCCAVVLVALISAIAVLTGKIVDIATNDKGGADGNNSIVSSENDKEIKKVASATVINTGDILVHNPVLDGAYNSSTGEYDFDGFFTEASSYFNAADLAVVNLEVTLGGSESGKYKGFPAFNTPDSVIDTLKSAGVDLCLTANNHAYDTGMFGMVRTVQVLKEKGMEYIGTRETDTEPTYIIKKINGIKIGMVCYTYSTPSGDRDTLNGNPLKDAAKPLVNYFDYNKIEQFYSDAQSKIAEMEKKGAEAIVFYMHWGNEYQLTPNTHQKSIAQRLCNLGVDVIVGGHPHVLQPIEMLYAEGGEHKTVCLYSMGNAISNQRREELTGLCTTGHTEDGILFSYTFDKYSDGTVTLSGVDAIPTWVNKVGERYSAKYTMYPLENATDGGSKYKMSAAVSEKMQKSYERSVAIIKAGLTACQTELGCEVRFK